MPATRKAKKSKVKNRARSPRRVKVAIVEPSAIVPPADVVDLWSQVGALGGMLKAHVREVERDRILAREFREEARTERQAATADRRALAGMIESVSTTLTKTTAAIAPITRRLDAIDDDQNERSLVSRFAMASAKVDRQEAKLALAAGVIGGAGTLVYIFFHTFGVEIKNFVVRKLGI